MEENNQNIVSVISSALKNFVSSIPVMDIVKQISSFTTNIFNSSGITEFVERQRKLAEDLKDLKFEDYDKYFEDKIARAKTLGKFGWVISPHMSVGDETQMALALMDGKNEKNYSKNFFYNPNMITRTIEEIRSNYLKADNLLFYINNFEKLLKKRDYTSASFYISSIIDYRMKKIFTIENMRRYEAIINTGINEKRKMYYQKSKKNKENIINIFVLTEFLPSFQEYAQRTFIEADGYKLGENEPPYFNRNWLMHGSITKKVERYQALQLLNALSCLESIIEHFKKYNLVNKETL